MKKLKIKIMAAGMAIILIFIFLAGCREEKIEEHSKSIFALNTVLSFKVYGGKKARKALDDVIDRVYEIEERMSATKEDSDIGRINQNAGKQPVKVNDDTFYVIEKALEYARLTEGAFDITIYSIASIWGIVSDNPRIPGKEELEQELDFVDYRQVKLDKSKKTVFLMRQGMGIDLGAIAKGYAADEAGRILRDAGVEHALINMGGNVLAVGSKVDGTAWKIGIQDPRSEETGEQHLAVISVKDSTVVSSGDYERYMVDVYKETGKRYHHIFDPKTGYPAESGLIACTVIGQSSIDADALSTILFIMGADRGLEFIEEIGNVSALAVTDDRKVYATDDLIDDINMSSKEYTLQR